jgi:hypothetical protein
MTELNRQQICAALGPSARAGRRLGRVAFQTLPLCQGGGAIEGMGMQESGAAAAHGTIGVQSYALPLWRAARRSG